MVTVDIPDDLPPLLLDYVGMDQVLSNLIENATKYTAPGSEIQVSARRANGEVWIEVADRGPGIPPSALPHLFEPFYRVDRQGPRPKGTGLGLAVAKGLVEAHGGRIWAENRAGGGPASCLRCHCPPQKQRPERPGGHTCERSNGGAHYGRRR